MEKILKFILLISMICFSKSSLSNSNVLRIPLHATKITLDPAGVQDISSLFVSRQINCQLVRSYGSIVTPEAAESTYFDTPQKIVIKIKKSAVFQDGSRVTSDDIIASFEHLKKSRLVLRNIFTWVSDIHAIGKNEIIITLKKPVPQFLKVLSSPNYAIFKKSFISKAEKNPVLWHKPIGCGNYKIAETSEKYLKLTPVREGRPIEFFLHPKNQLTAEEINQYDVSDLSLINDSAKDLPFNKIEIFDPTQVYLGLNTKAKRWRNREGRCQFISMLDRSAVLKAYGNIAKPATSILPSGIIGYTPESITKKSKNINARLSGKKQTFCLSYLTVSIPEHYRPSILNMVKSVFPSVITINQNDNKHFGSDFVKTQCDAIALGLKSNTLDGYDILAVFSEIYPNFTGFFDTGISKEIENSQNEANPTARAAIYQDIVRKLNDKCLVYPILTVPVKTVYIRKTLYAPNIGKGPLNEYYLGEIR